MKNNNFRKQLSEAVCIALAATLMLTGCNSKKDDNGSSSADNSKSSSDSGSPISTELSKDCIYHEAAMLAVPEGFDIGGQICSTKDKIYVCGSKYSAATTETNIFVFDSSGNLTETVPVSTNDNSSVQAFTADNDGNIYYVLYEYVYIDDSTADVIPKDEAAEPTDDSSAAEDSSAADDTSSSDDSSAADDDSAIDDVQEGTEKFTLVKIDASGNEVFSTDLSKFKPADADYFYVQNICCSNGNLYFSNDQGMIFVLDSEGNELYTIEGKSSYIDRILVTNDGKTVAAYYDDEWNYNVSLIDDDNKTLADPYKIDNAPSGISYMDGGGDYSLCYYNSTEMYGINLETSEKTKIIDWIDSDVDASSLQTAKILSDGRIIAVYYDIISSQTKYSILEKTNPDDVKNQQVVTLAGTYIDSNIYAAAAKFNKENEKYRIKLTDYSSYNTDDDYNAGANKFNMDMALGTVPDIVLLNYDTNIKNLVSKGILADMGAIIDNDSSINRSDYLENVFDALSVNGTLYSVSPSFNIQTLTGKTSNLDGMTEWDTNTFIDFINNLDENKQIMTDDDLNSDNILSMLCYLSIDNFINYSEKTCNFNSDDFIKILEFAKQYPTSEEYYSQMQDMSDDEYQKKYNDQQAGFRKGNIILERSYFYDTGSFYNTEMGTFGEDVTFIGYPSSDGNGSFINASLEMGISAKSENQEAAWEFIKYFLSDEYQKSVYELPVKKSVLEEKFNASMKPYSYEDEDGNTVELPNTYYIGDDEIDIGYMDETHKKKYMDFVSSVNKKYTYDLNVMDIISEETQAFFSGQKSAQETADIVQNRVNIYINETL